MPRRLIRLISVLLGALPATLLAPFAVLVMLEPFYGITSPSVEETLLILWGMSGVLGAFGAWLIIFDVGTRTPGIRRLVIFMASAGIAAASILLFIIFAEWFLASSSGGFSIFDLFSRLWVASAIGVGIFQICRVSGATPMRIVGWIAAFYLLGIGFVVGEPLYTNVVDIERQVTWKCMDPGCSDIMYSFHSGSAWYQMGASNDLIVHMKNQKETKVSAKLRVQTRFGRFESFSIVELAGFSIEGESARNRNQPTPPFPMQGIDDNVDGRGI